MEDQKKNTPAAEGAAVKKPSSKSTKGKKRVGTKKHVAVPHGKAFVHATYNNTIITLADLNGNVLSWSSAGACGFTGPKKSTPYAASMVVKKALDKIADYGLKEVNVYITGVGQGRESAIRAFNANGVNVLTIQDVTPIPHNGCRAPRPRRV